MTKKLKINKKKFFCCFLFKNNQAVEYQQHTQITNGKSQSMSSLMLPQQKPLITTIQHARGVINKAQLNLHQRTIIQNDIGNDPVGLFFMYFII